MADYLLSVTLVSDATFGRGEGVAGLVDVEISHDADGFPFVNGRTLKGLLVEEWVNFRYALGDNSWDAAATQLFGVSGATDHEAMSILRIGNAELPEDLRQALRAEIKSEGLRPQDVLASLTTIRRQTSIDARDGAPEAGSLRAIRVLLRETTLFARLQFLREPDEHTLVLLAACVLGVRRGGSGRNRGRGRISLLLHERSPLDPTDATFTQRCFNRFAAEVLR